MHRDKTKDKKEIIILINENQRIYNSIKINKLKMQLY